MIMSKFSENWKKEDESRSSGGFGFRIRNAVKTPEPLRPKIELATRQIQLQITRLNSTSAKLKEKDASIFNKVVTLIQKHDTQRANMLANELSEIRKMSKMVTHSKLALEQIELRLNTIQDLGDIAVMLSPAVGIIRSVGSELTSVVPEAQSEVGEISNLLSNILVDAGQMSATSINFESANEEADRVLAEASAVAEQRMRDRFPDLPESVETGSNRFEETLS